jgi:aspartyl-tRNA synthetase
MILRDGENLKVRRNIPMAVKKETLVERQETLKVKDFTEVVKGVTGLVRENYLNSFEFALSLWEENLRILNAQVDQWQNFQQDYINAGREFYSKFPKEVATPWSENLQRATNNTIDRFVAFQEGYISSVTSASDKFIKKTLSLTQNNIEKAFSLFDDYLTLFRV